MLSTIDETAQVHQVVRPPRFRGDIDGLRAIAIVLIIGFHVELPGFAGGFVGVDVFFVISGYLITRNLLREERRVELMRFWAKRIRRLVPALSLMVLVTLLAAAVILPAIDIAQVAKEGVAAAVYVSNILFARASEGYFAADVTQSPFLHTWSLGVEEQFYLVWPLLFAGCALAVRRREHLLRPVLLMGFTIILIGSFALNVMLTDRGSPWAFFGLPTRAWQFAAAGLLAAISTTRVVRGVAARTACALSGLAMIGFAALTFDWDTPYPGTAALVPVVGTVLLIVAGEGLDATTSRSPVSSALSTAPLQWIGRVSYSWYLWHWPLIILMITAFDDRVRYRAIAAAASLPIAYATYRLVENPIRFRSRFTRSTPRTFAMGAVATTVVLAAAAGVAYSRSDPPDSSLDGKLEASREVVKVCDRRRSPSGIQYCTAGDLSSSTVVMFTGDSHGLVWVDAMGRAANELGVLLVHRIYPGCPPIEVTVKPERAGGLTPAECESKRAIDQQLIAELQPRAVILAQSDGYSGFLTDSSSQDADPETQAEMWADAYRAFLIELRQAGMGVAVLRDNPRFSSNPTTCIARERSVEACTSTRAEALKIGSDLRAAGRAAIDAVGRVPTVELIDLLCDESTCPLEMNDALVYMDTDHLAHATTIHLQPRIRQLLQDALAAS